MKILLLYFISVVYTLQIKAQEVSVDILQQGRAFSDSSYYDIIKVENKFWICGKYGILKSIDSNGTIENIHYPNINVDIYKLENLDNETVVASGDKGIVYFHNLKNKTWKTIKVKGYEKACFYNLTVDSKKNIYLCGGNSKIAHSGKTIPNGFIIVSSDMGLTWKRIYKNVFNMVWCVKNNNFDNKVYALMYSPNRTNLMVLENNKWSKKEKIGNTIFHEIQFDQENQFIATGGWMGKKGRIYTHNNKKIFNESGLIWGRVKNEKYTVYTGCNGNVVVDFANKKSLLHHTNLNLPFNIYEAIFIDETSAFAVGSGQTLLKINIKENSNFETKNY